MNLTDNELSTLIFALAQHIRTMERDRDTMNRNYPIHGSAPITLVDRINREQWLHDRIVSEMINRNENKQNIASE